MPHYISQFDIGRAEDRSYNIIITGKVRDVAFKIRLGKDWERMEVITSAQPKDPVLAGLNRFFGRPPIASFRKKEQQLYGTNYLWVRNTEQEKRNQLLGELRRDKKIDKPSVKDLWARRAEH
ncbi:hypothetical protein ACFL31_05090 [Candidatus Margulisiibacteriota bacterium]